MTVTQPIIITVDPHFDGKELLCTGKQTMKGEYIQGLQGIIT